ncbi:MAG: hypothetical protein QOE05_3096 [Actinomycetota bacterium]|nr:hypothetical protein [Actinomycetota bacterium]
MTVRRLRALTAAIVATAALLPAVASASAGPAEQWFSAWSRPQSVMLGAAADGLDGGRGPGPLLDQSVRDVVRLAASGSAVRIRLSNRYGAALSPEATVPLLVDAITVAQRSTDAGLVAGTLRRVTFSGHAAVTIPPGGTVVSDPVPLAVAFGEDVAVSLHVPQAPVGPQHGASFVTSWVTAASSGDHTTQLSGSAYTERTFSTLLLTGIDVRSHALRGVVAATGGSVVDGFGTEIDSYSDFPAWLAQRVRGQQSVVNNGLGGTTAASACAPPGVGPSVEERVAHDSLALPGVTHLIVYAGTNDLGDGCNATQIIDAYRSIIRQAHARHVRVLVSTITPRGQYTPLQNAERELVNAWVRRGGTCGGECDHGLDFDVVVRDPSDHNRIDPKLDSGDGVHPTGEGYRRIAASIPLSYLAG